MLTGFIPGPMALAVAPAYTGLTSQFYMLLKFTVFLLFAVLLFAAAAYYLRDITTRHSILFRMLGVLLIVAAVLLVVAKDLFRWPVLLVLTVIGLAMDYLFISGAMHPKMPVH